MLLEEPNGCCICGNPVSGHVGGVPVYFCNGCFKAYERDILEKVTWVAMLANLEKQRRKRRNRLIKSIGIPKLVNTYQGVAL